MWTVEAMVFEIEPTAVTKPVTTPSLPEDTTISNVDPVTEKVDTYELPKGNFPNCPCPHHHLSYGGGVY